MKLGLGVDWCHISEDRSRLDLVAGLYPDIGELAVEGEIASVLHQHAHIVARHHHNALDHSVEDGFHLLPVVEGDIDAVVEGKSIDIGFNPRYVLEALKAIEDEEICIEFNSSISPVLIKPVNKNDFIYVVLPIKLRQE